MSGVPGWHSKLKADAKARGLKRFASPLRCKHGHVGDWIVASGHCGECARLHSIKKDAANPEKRRARLARYRAKHYDTLKLRAKSPANRIKGNAKAARWRALNPEKVKAIIEKRKPAEAAYRLRNKEKKNAYSARYRRDHKAQVAAGMASWTARNKVKKAAYDADYRTANPERIRVIHQNRRARSGGGKISSGIAKRLMILQRGKCACCRCDLSKTKYHLDHIEPLALGGAHVDSNIQLLCQTCNQQKHAKHPVDFMQSRGFLL